MPETERQSVQMQPPGWAPPVDRISDDRMADVGQVRAELMGAPGQRPQPELGSAMERPSDTPKRAATASFGVASVTRRLTLQPGQRCIEAAPSGQHTIDLSHIQLVHPAMGEERTATAQALKPASQQQNSRGVTVQTVNQMQITIPRAQTRDQGVLLVGSKSRLAQQSSRLVHCQQPWIPMQKLQQVRAQDDRRNA